MCQYIPAFLLPVHSVLLIKHATDKEYCTNTAANWIQRETTPIDVCIFFSPWNHYKKYKVSCYYFKKIKLNPVLIIFILLIMVCYPITKTQAQKHVKTPRHKHSHTWFTDLLICGFGLYLRFGLWDQKKGIDPRVCKRMEMVLNSRIYKTHLAFKNKEDWFILLN